MRNGGKLSICGKDNLKMKEYEQQVLRKLQLAELEILKVFDTLCRKFNIPYVIFYGSAIGAIRHGGFIPWDDEIDVCMLRKDYETFLQVAEEEYREKYYLLTAEKDNNFPFMGAHWGPGDTSFIIAELKDVPCKFTIFLDIHPLDAISDNKFKRRRQCIEAWFWQKLMLLRQLPYPANGYQGLKRRLFHFICGMTHIVLKVLHLSPNWLYKKCKKTCMRYERVSTQNVAFPTGHDPNKNIFSKSDLFPQSYFEFEGVMLPFPKETKKLLTEFYGDFMKLPPVEARRNHFPYLLDFGDGEVYKDEEV